MNTLQNKILLYFLVVAVIVIIILGAVHTILMNNLFDRYLEESVSDAMLAVRAFVENYYEQNGSLSGIEVYFRGRHMMMGGVVILADAGGNVVVGPASLVGQRLAAGELQRGLPLSAQGRRIGTLLSSAIVTHVQGVRSLEHEFRRSFNFGSLWSGAVALLVALGLGVVISRQLMAPIAEIDQAATTLGAGKLHYRIPARYQEKELASLVDSFNHMASQLERNERARRNLVADVAHELRTPLTIIRASLESILAGVSQPEAEQMASLYDEASRITRLVEDLQSLSMAEAGQLSLSLGEHNVQSEIAKVIDNLKPAAEEMGIELDHDRSVDPLLAVVDRDRLRQVVFNLVWNALQYNREQGRVKVSAHRDQTEIKIVIADTGQGIPETELPHVFDRFYRGDKARQRTGTGLGLAIAKEFTESMQGSISVESALHQGSTFILTFPGVLKN